jgi:hypothetical protein
MRVGSFLYHSSKSNLYATKVVKVGASTRKAFALPCAALCVAQVWSQAIASHHELRRADYSTLLGVVSLLVCSPACLPAARKVLLRAPYMKRGWLA